MFHLVVSTVSADGLQPFCAGASVGQVRLAFCEESIGDQWFLSQRASNEENVSMSRHIS